MLMNFYKIQKKAVLPLFFGVIYSLIKRHLTITCNLWYNRYKMFSVRYAEEKIRSEKINTRRKKWQKQKN